MSIDFVPLIHERTQEFSGSEWVFEQINAWLEKQDGRLFVLSGGPGSGKTTLAARLAQFSLGEIDHQEFPALKPGFLAYFHFCQATYDTTLDPVDFIRNLSLALSAYSEFSQALIETNDPSIHVQSEISSETIESGATVKGIVIKELTIGSLSARLAWNQLIRRPIERLCTAQPELKLTILVDSLDEALTIDPENNITTLLKHTLDHPDELPSQVRFILLGRFDSPQLESMFGATNLDLGLELSKRSLDIYNYCIGQLEQLTMPQKNRLADKLAKTARGNFLYARFVVKDLAKLSDLPEDLDDLKLPDGLYEAYRKYLERIVQPHTPKWTDRYRPTLGLLSVARGQGLTRTQISGILGMSAGLEEDDVLDILDSLSQYLQRGKSEEKDRLYHNSFRNFLIEDKDYRVHPSQSNYQIARFFTRIYGDDWIACLDDYALRYTQFHLEEALRLMDKPEQKLARQPVEANLSMLRSDLFFRWARSARFGRDWILRSIQSWLFDENGQPFFMIYGAPGTGKTDLAKLLERISQGLIEVDRNEFPRLITGWLDHVHYCQLIQPDTVNPASFIRSLSEGLASHLPQFKDLIIRKAPDSLQIEQRVDIGTQDQGGQVIGIYIKNLNLRIDPRPLFHQLILEPLQEVVNQGYPGNIIILIDALDESIYDRGQISILDLLEQAKNKLPAQVRFIITARKEPLLFSRLAKPTIDLDENRMANLDEIGAYAYKALAGKASELPWLKDLTKEEIANTALKIADSSQGLFLFARNMVDSILGNTTDYRQLQLQFNTDNFNQIIHSQLQKRFKSLDSWLKVRPVFGVIAYSFVPGLDRDQIAWICGIRVADLSNILIEITPYLTGNYLRGPFQLFHTSLDAFFSSEENIHFWIDPFQVNLDIIQSYQASLPDQSKDWDDYGINHLTGHIQNAINLLETPQRAAERHHYRQHLTDIMVELLGSAVYRHEKINRCGPEAFRDEVQACLKLLPDDPDMRKRLEKLPEIANFDHPGK